MKKFIRYFIQGLLYLAPTGITIFIVLKAFSLLFKLVRSGFEKYLPESFPEIGIIGIGIMIIPILAAIIALLGLVGPTIIFRPIRIGIDRVMNNAPIIKVIYSAIRDLLSAFVGKEKKFNQPVLVRVNLISNLEKMGFLTTEDLSDLEIKDKVAVYFPHSYNFSGEMFIVPKEHIRLLDIPASDAMKFIVSGGVTKV
ncbi:MAG: DUF502 domain-containing protein [Bacteroidales bacterium]|nr:DUF502 domain-containing protein [Bacteroidales bacterium]